MDLRKIGFSIMDVAAAMICFLLYAVPLLLIVSVPFMGGH